MPTVSGIGRTTKVFFSVVKSPHLVLWYLAQYWYVPASVHFLFLNWALVYSSVEVGALCPFILPTTILMWVSAV